MSVLLIVGALLSVLAGPAPVAASGPAGVHDFHVSYSHLAVEGEVAVLRIRFFKDDLEDVLGRFGGGEGFRMEADPAVDALFMKYFDERFDLSMSGAEIAGRLIGSGEDEIDREPVWWYLVQFVAEAPIRSLRIRNALMFDSFSDQKNILKAVHFPDETQRTFYFAAGEEALDVSF